MSVRMSLGEAYFIQEFLDGVQADQRRGRPARPKPKAAPRTRDVRLRFLATRIHALGPRPLYELMRELCDGHDLIDALERYARLDPGVVRALGGDAFTLGVFDGGRTC